MYFVIIKGGGEVTLSKRGGGRRVIVDFGKGDGPL